MMTYCKLLILLTLTMFFVGNANALTLKNDSDQSFSNTIIQTSWPTPCNENSTISLANGENKVVTLQDECSNKDRKLVSVKFIYDIYKEVNCKNIKDGDDTFKVTGSKGVYQCVSQGSNRR